MMKIEDIMLNFNDYLYEFYEWNKNDQIIHIKNTCAIKVNDQIIDDFIKSKVKVDSVFLDVIKDKTEVYTYTSSYKLNYIVILYNDDIAVAFKFDSNGICTGKSRLLYDEEDEIIKKSKSNKVSIKYEVLNKINTNIYTTRYERKLINYLSKYFDDLYNEKKYDAIKYYYLECFNNDYKSYDEAYKILKDSIINNKDEIILKIKNIIKLVKN